MLKVQYMHGFLQSDVSKADGIRCRDSQTSPDMYIYARTTEVV